MYASYQKLIVRKDTRIREKIYIPDQTGAGADATPAEQHQTMPVEDTPVVECPSCGNVLTGKVCACGYAVRPSVAKRDFTSDPQKASNDAFNARLREVETFVANYQTQHPGATKRQACLAYLKSRGQEKLIPPHIRESSEPKKRSFDDAMDDYYAEQAASMG